MAKTSSDDPLGSSYAGAKGRKKPVSKSLGIFAALSHPSSKLLGVDQEFEDGVSDADSTCVGSDRDVVDLTDASEGEWQSVHDVINTMEIEYEEYQPPPPQLPKGYSQRSKPSPEPVEGPPSKAKPRSWRESVEQDLAQLYEEQIPDIPVTSNTPQLHREKVPTKRWPFNACVARPVIRKELMATLAALEARNKEWKKLVDKGVFGDFADVREWSHVAAAARRKRKTVHMGMVFWICVEKNAELKLAERVFKYRYVFQGNRVKD